MSVAQYNLCTLSIVNLCTNRDRALQSISDESRLKHRTSWPRFRSTVLLWSLERIIRGCTGIALVFQHQRSQSWVRVWLSSNQIVHGKDALEACEQLLKGSSCHRHTVIPVDHLLNICVGPLIRHRFATRLESSELPVSLLSCRTFSEM